MAWWDHTHASPVGTIGNAQGQTLETHWHNTPCGPTDVAASIVYGTTSTTHTHASPWGPLGTGTSIGATMSNLVFPSTLPGFDIKVTREPYANVNIQESVSGKELRSSWWGSMRTRYKLALNCERTAAAWQELQTLATFYARHFGQLDSFLFVDPVDNVLTAAGIGVGDGSTKAFQIQRSLLGNVIDSMGATSAMSSVPRTNLLTYSQDFTNAVWTKANLGSHSLAVAPDGTKTADSYTASGAGSITRAMSTTAAQAYTLSLWARCAAGTTLSLGSTEGVGSTQTITATAKRISITFTAASTSTTLTIGAASSWSTGTTIELWGAQFETGTAPTQYIACVASSLTALPHYWPDFSEGFEPIYDIALGTLQVYVDGTLKALTTDYTVNSLGMVTFGTAPIYSQVVTVSCSYFKRVRFDMPSMSSDQIAQYMWQTSSIALVSVKP